MQLIYIYMYQALIATLNCNTLAGILFSRFLAITFVIACKSYAWY